MPTAINFLTVPAELQAIAHACRKYLRDHGYSLSYEQSEADFPEAATILAKRGREQHFYIFDARIKLERVKLWAGYGRSCSSTTMIVLCVPQGDAFSGDDLARIRDLGIGLTTIDDAGNLANLVLPVDLSVNVTLPPLSRHRVAMRGELGKVHERFRQDWKEGFEDACKLVEKNALKYLKREAKAGRVQLPGRPAPRILSVADLRRMTLGQLKDVFCNKLWPTQIDSLLCSGLKRINPDRIKVAHATLTRQTERRLRENVGRHMWTIDNLLMKIPA